MRWGHIWVKSGRVTNVTDSGTIRDPIHLDVLLDMYAGEKHNKWYWHIYSHALHFLDLRLLVLVAQLMTSLVVVIKKFTGSGRQRQQMSDCQKDHGSGRQFTKREPDWVRVIGIYAWLMRRKERQLRLDTLKLI